MTQLDCWTDGLKWVVKGSRACNYRFTFKESKNNKFKHKKKKHPGFLLPMFRITGPYSGITVELRQI